MKLKNVLYILVICIPTCKSIDLLPSSEILSNIRNEFNERYPCLDLGKMVPCQIWITGKHLSKHRHPAHVAKLISRNNDWQMHLIDDAGMNKFMKHVFDGTQVLWAYEQINPQLGASRADFWRIAVLFVYGGAYVDLDAKIDTPLNQVMPCLF